MNADHIHLVFFKLHDAAEQRALWSALRGAGASVLTPADAAATKAWDAAVVVSGAPQHVKEQVALLHGATKSLAVEVTKGWTFAAMEGA